MVADKGRRRRRARKRAFKGLKRATRNLHHQPRSRKKDRTAWLIAGLLLTAIVGTIVMVRALRAQRCPEAPGTIESVPDPTGIPEEVLSQHTNGLDQPAQENEEPSPSSTPDDDADTRPPATTPE